MILGPEASRQRARLFVQYLEPFMYGKKRIWGVAMVSSVVLLGAFYFNVYRAPNHFPRQEVVQISQGMTLEGVAQHLKQVQIIRSPFLLRTAVVIFGGEKNVFAGDYYFDAPQGVFTVAYRIAHGLLELTPITVRVREGATVEEMALLFSAAFIEFDTNVFRQQAVGNEGYLFPDTYHLPPNAKAQQVISIMRSTFETRIATISDEITAFGKPLSDVVTMASIIEKEGRSLHDKRLIASVLWNRIRIGMALQVDASFLYILGKGTAELSLDDLKTESPYNTYLHRGLPPGPIGSPSLESLLATVTPAESDYFYYLADKDGVTHFSKTFEEHKQNKERYLN